VSTPHPADEAVRELMLVMPRLVGRVKRIPVPEQLRSFDLAPRHLSLLSLLLLDGPQTVSELAAHLSVAPTTVSLMVGDLSRKGVLVRREDDADRRRRIVDISAASRPAISQWLSPGAQAWRQALGPLTPAQRRVVVDTLLAYEAAVSGASDAGELSPPTS
jgi:DNA-binding MarR family transcriptional regulator